MIEEFTGDGEIPYGFASSLRSEIIVRYIPSQLAETRSYNGSAFYNRADNEHIRSGFPTEGVYEFVRSDSVDADRIRCTCW